MMNDISRVCDKEIVRLNKNVRAIISKDKVTDEDLSDLNRYYDDLDFYNYHKNYKQFQRILTEEYENE